MEPVGLPVPQLVAERLQPQEPDSKPPARGSPDLRESQKLLSTRDNRWPFP